MRSWIRENSAPHFYPRIICRQSVCDVPRGVCNPLEQPTRIHSKWLRLGGKVNRDRYLHTGWYRIWMLVTSSSWELNVI